MSYKYDIDKEVELAQLCITNRPNLFSKFQTLYLISSASNLADGAGKFPKMISPVNHQNFTKVKPSSIAPTDVG